MNAKVLKGLVVVVVLGAGLLMGSALLTSGENTEATQPNAESQDTQVKTCPFKSAESCCQMKKEAGCCPGDGGESCCEARKEAGCCPAAENPEACPKSNPEACPKSNPSGCPKTQDTAACPAEKPASCCPGM